MNLFRRFVVHFVFFCHVQASPIWHIDGKEYIELLDVFDEDSEF